MPTDTAPATDSPSDAQAIDTRLIRKLAGILKDTGLSEIEVERGDLRIRVARELTVAAAAPMALAAAPVAAAPAAASVPAESTPARAAASGDTVTSPMVGTVYMQPQPGAEPFVRVGTQVAEGQTLLIVEAMKTMNPIPAPRAGRVAEILVSDAQPVEFGEPLVVLE